MFKKQNILFVEWTALPEHVKEALRDWHLFGNDRALELSTSYRLGDGPQKPEHMLRPENFQSFYGDVVRDKEFVGTFEAFLAAYDFVAFHWLSTSGQDFAGVDAVYVDISW